MPSPTLRWTMPYDVCLAFSTAADGDCRDAGIRQRWLASLGHDLALRPVAVAVQVHGTVVRDAADALTGPADGLVSDDPRQAIGVFGADCPGLCLAAPDAIGVAHCGWRGTAGGIVGQLADALAARSAFPRSSWRALVGPGICGDEYEVDAPVLSSRRWPAAALRPRDGGRALLDLPLAIAADCAAAGIGSVERSGVCTRRDPRLRSYRGDGPGFSQLLLAWRS